MIVDSHSHIASPEAAARYPMPASLRDTETMIAGKLGLGVTTSVVGSPAGAGPMVPMPGAAEASRDPGALSRLHDWLAEMVTTYPENLRALVWVHAFATEQELDRAAEAYRTGPFVGFMVNSSVDGSYLDSPRADAFFDMVDECGAPVVMHAPAAPAAGAGIGDLRLLEQLGRFCDVTVGLSACLLSGRFERHPKLRLLATAGGGALSLAVERLDAAWEAVHWTAGRPPAGRPQSAGRPPASALPAAAALPKPPSQYLSQVWVDTATPSRRALEANLELLGPGHVLFGTDSPPLDATPAQYLRMVGDLTDESLKERILTTNAEEFFTFRMAASTPSASPPERAASIIGTRSGPGELPVRNLTAPIRERFEIQVVPTAWGNLPFLAVTDTADHNMPRFEGSWDQAGTRLVEHEMGWPTGYYLWCWDNPRTDLRVERIEIIPRGPRFIVAGITTSDLDEYPFVREPARPVLLVPKDGKEGVLDVDVDRGVATYPQPLPGRDDRVGWGATPGSTAYASIAALPSATIAVRRGDDELGRVRWGDLERDGRAGTGRVSLELADGGRNWVHVTVVDDATGRPVPCRVHFRSPQGIPYQPHGHHNHVTQNLGSWHYDVGGDVRLAQRSYAYIDGTCQGRLPRGDAIVDVARGFEYEPLRQTVRIEPGQRDLTLRISRVADMAAQGWWSGDSHVHFLSTPGAQLEQKGEDLRVVNLLQTQWGALFTNTEDSCGQPGVVESNGYVTYVGQENRQHVLGHLVLWGLNDPVMPWCSDGPDEAELGGALDVTLSDWADRTHAQGGTVVVAHFPNPNGEPAVLVATGRADAVELLAVHPGADPMLEYYRYLNSGYRLPLVGGTDKMSSAVPVGLYRTYARLDEEFSYEAWCRAVRSGRTFLSGGPLVSLSVDGREPGDTVQLSGPGTVSVHARASGVFPLESLEIVRNGEVVARAEASGGRHAEISEELPVDGNSWIACRAFGVDYHLDDWGRRVFAHTSPVYVACGGEWAMADPAGLRYIRTLVEGAREYVRHTAVRRPDRLTTHHHGQADHLAWLERPFAEALRALDARR
jgi:predicted TIM-barrel fold metal-dependent hydrolase